ncbi:HAD-IA family hydrolase [Donghicola sp.]|jgi:phosphoglycolate phosphatase|uniref:HAD-IA family hydrolase n=1 Tax=Donghicola sp. TaxID=1929294 RepID=UPI002600970A|nr:HAD-IA family hydrolase [Donghicola sp.]MCT4579298.1 HAD-IA family hydrolase [Donghicola sp.]
MTLGPLRLIIFDVDGTLVDSQADILASMAAGFAAGDVPVPERAAILSIVGMSLEKAIPVLAPDASAATHAVIVDGYKSAYQRLRAEKGAASSPFYPGVRDTLEHLFNVPEYLVGVATGKSRRGLTALLDSHGLTGRFVTEQVADFHPSKPHPAMIHAALSETGVEPENAVMVGDTTFDMDMARAAGIGTIGVSWGYHSPDKLNADVTLTQMTDLPAALKTIWRD